MTRPAKGRVEVRRRIDASPETVFSYFTDPAKYRKWQGVEAELDPRPGGVFRVTVTGRTRHVASGTFIEVDPPTRLVFTWGWEPADTLPEGQVELPPGSSTVEVVLVPDGSATLLHLVHGDLPTEPACRMHTWGWELTLDRLVIAAAGNDPGPDLLATL